MLSYLKKDTLLGTVIVIWKSLKNIVLTDDIASSDNILYYYKFRIPLHTVIKNNTLSTQILKGYLLHVQTVFFV